MAYDYGVQHVPEQAIEHADAMSRLRFKNDGKDLVATVTATFEKPVDFLQIEMATDHFNERVIEKIPTGTWNNCTNLKIDLAKKQMP